jgi:hypothetical protein
VEKKLTVARATSSRLWHFIKGSVEVLRAFSVCLGEKAHLLYDSDHKVIGILAVCPSVFLVTGIPFSFFE